MSAMLEPGFYPKRPSKVTHKETHISHVFLTDHLVYKVKKPVRFSFLDYSTLAKRRHFLNEELRLNRRLAPSAYLAVMPITTDGKLEVGRRRRTERIRPRYAATSGQTHATRSSGNPTGHSENGERAGRAARAFSWRSQKS